MVMLAHYQALIMFHGEYCRQFFLYVRLKAQDTFIFMYILKFQDTFIFTYI